MGFDIDWSIVHQNGIIEKKLRPWVRKKVTEYLGAEEQGMIEFIMRKVSAHEKPSKILAELEGFLDEEDKKAKDALEKAKQDGDATESDKPGDKSTAEKEK